MQATENRGSGIRWWIAGGLAGALVTREVLRHRRRIELAGRVALITGGSRGLGLVLARRLAAEGMKLALCARDERELVRAREELEASGAEVLALPCDVGEQSEVDLFVAHVIDRFGAIDVLVNNAGVIQVGPPSQMTLVDFEAALRVHLWGPLHFVHAVLPHMRRGGGGRIVNVASFGGKVSVPHLLPYCTSKFALVGFSQGLRSALAPEGIHVTTVCPGPMRTGSPRNALFKGQHAREYAWFAALDSVPVASVGAERMARRIADAVRHGDAEVELPFVTWLAARVQGLAPSVAEGLIGLFERTLPDPSDDVAGRVTVRGAETGEPLAPRWLTALGDAAARRNNEIADR